MTTIEEDADFADLDLYEDESDGEDTTVAAPADSNKQVVPLSKTGDHVAFHAAGFRDFLLRPELLRAIVDCGFEHPSEVQHECIPPAILGTDVICQAKSGMGKTAVFVLSVLQQLDANPLPGSVIVLCHARELAFQIQSEFDRFIKYLPNIKTTMLVGGVPVSLNTQQLSEKPHIIVGTPGRVLELARTKSLSLNNVKHFIVDECDSMLDQVSMRQDVQNIFKLTPRDKQTMMFSATLPEEIRMVCKKFMHDPLEILINDGSKLRLHGLQQYYVGLAENEKNRKLVDLIDALEFNQLVIFVNSVQRASELNKLLVQCNFPSSCLHSGLKQEERIETYKKFKEFKTRIMVATNLMGRGIDIERVNIVINYDMPQDTATYLHRVARAGRFGTKGLAIAFVTSPSDKQVLADVQARFVVQVSELPDEIDASTYMGA